MTDCLVIGYNDYDFKTYVNMVKRMGTGTGAYKDLSLAFIEIDNQPYHAMDVLNHFRAQVDPHHRRLDNSDFLWPVVTYLTSYLKRRGFTADYVNLFQIDREKLREQLVNGEVRTVAITTTLYVIPHPIMEIIGFIRRWNRQVKIIVGGPFIQNQTTAKMYDAGSVQLLFKSLGADFYVISQEGEQALAQILTALWDGTSLEEIPNIAFRNGKDFQITPALPERNSLEENPVDYTLFPRAEVGQFVTLRTAKSCPFACAFCGFPQRAGKYVYTDVEHVEQDLNAIREIGGVTTLTFIDDTFNIPKSRFQELLRMMIRNKYGFKWNSFYRSDHGDEETINLMAEAGCEGVFLGVESGSDTILEKMNKTSRRKHYMKAIPQFRKAGIVTHASLIVGFPGDTRETVAESISLVNEAQPDFFRAQLWYCDPMTPIWARKEELGVEGSGFSWTHHTMDSKEACQIIDEIFLSVDRSVWLPQNGFEFWSVFYLQRHGMTLDQIKHFLRGFNNIIRERLRGNEPIDSRLMETLRQASLAGHSDRFVPQAPQ